MLENFLSPEFLEQATRFPFTSLLRHCRYSSRRCNNRPYHQRRMKGMLEKKQNDAVHGISYVLRDSWMYLGRRLDSIIA